MTSAVPEAKPRLALLFWFYKDLEVCKNRLQILRRLNPGIPVFGLYGGDPAEALHFRAELGPLLDNFSDCLAERDANWKWLYGDAIIAEWYQKSGHALDWDTVVLVQWDMLILKNIPGLLSGLQIDELVLSGLRPIEEVSSWWNRVTRDHEEYAAFLRKVQERHGRGMKVLCCQFVFACLPRSFIAAYRNMDLTIGFLEYRLPTYAAFLGHEFRSYPPFECWWPNDPQTRDLPATRRPVTAQRLPIAMSTIVLNLLRPAGSKVFHPFYRPFPLTLLDWLGVLLGGLRVRKIQRILRPKAE